MNVRGKPPHRRVTIWLGSDDSDPAGAGDYDYEISREDDMVLISHPGGAHGEGEALEVFILPDLFPAIRQVIDMLEGRKSA